MSLRSLIIIAIIVILAVGGAGTYFYMSSTGMLDGSNTATDSTPTASSTTFLPFSRTPQGVSPSNNQTNTAGSSSGTTTLSTTSAPTAKAPISVLRLLSNTPVGGYGANTTATSTVVRWIDRGRGNIFETKGNSSEVLTLSNTIVPRVYSSVWNKTLTAFIGETLSEGSEISTTIYAELRPQTFATTSTSSQSLSQTPYTLKGKGLPEDVLATVSSPTGNKIFILIKDGVGSIGYIANFDGTKLTRLFETPLTQINVAWPTENNIAITTKGSASYPGYLYLVNTSSGIWTKVAGPIKGLSARISPDGKLALISSSLDRGVALNLYNIATGSSTDTLLKTMADKCVWGNFYKELAYCAVPFQPVLGTYPDDWYKGTISTVDKIWQINSTTGEIKLVGQLVGQIKNNIDAFNLGLDEKDLYLFFMNKNDLSLWSLDLVRSN